MKRALLVTAYGAALMGCISNSLQARPSADAIRRTFSDTPHVVTAGQFQRGLQKLRRGASPEVRKNLDSAESQFKRGAFDIARNLILISNRDEDDFSKRVIAWRLKQFLDARIAAPNQAEPLKIEASTAISIDDVGTKERLFKLGQEAYERGEMVEAEKFFNVVPNAKDWR